MGISSKQHSCDEVWQDVVVFLIPPTLCKPASLEMKVPLFSEIQQEMLEHVAKKSGHNSSWLKVALQDALSCDGKRAAHPECHVMSRSDRTFVHNLSQISLAALPIDILREHKNLTYKILPTEQNRNRRISLPSLPWRAKWKSRVLNVRSPFPWPLSKLNAVKLRTGVCVTCILWTLDSKTIQAANFTTIYVCAI